MGNVKITVNREGMRELFHSKEWADVANGVGFALVSAAVPFSGVDTGEAIGSMSHRLEDDGDALIIVCGSNAGVPGKQDKPVWYTFWHWMGKVPRYAKAFVDAASRKPRERRRRIPHPTKPAPTTPWVKGFESLGWDYEIEGDRV